MVLIIAGTIVGNVTHWGHFYRSLDSYLASLLAIASLPDRGVERLMSTSPRAKITDVSSYWVRPIIPSISLLMNDDTIRYFSDIILSKETVTEMHCLKENIGLLKQIYAVVRRSLGSTLCLFTVLGLCKPVLRTGRHHRPTCRCEYTFSVSWNIYYAMSVWEIGLVKSMQTLFKLVKTEQNRKTFRTTQLVLHKKIVFRVGLPKITKTAI